MPTLCCAFYLVLTKAGATENFRVIFKSYFPLLIRHKTSYEETYLGRCFPNFDVAQSS